MNRLVERLREGIDPNDVPDAEKIMDTAADELDRYVFVLGEIARGRCDNGRPLAAEKSRQMARDVLHFFGREWPKGGR